MLIWCCYKSPFLLNTKSFLFILKGNALHSGCPVHSHSSTQFYFCKDANNHLSVTSHSTRQHLPQSSNINQKPGTAALPEFFCIHRGSSSQFQMHPIFHSALLHYTQCCFLMKRCLVSQAAVSS